MTPDQQARRDQILEEALGLDPEACAAYLDDACGDDLALREDVERLLRVHLEMETGFLDAPPVGRAAPDLRIGQRIGRYELVEHIGTGGMGVVFKAHDPSIDRLVAIKVLHSTTADPRARGRFLSEVRTLGRIRHDNVVQVHDVGKLGEVPFIVMEFLEGENLAASIAGGRAGDLARKLDIARQIGAALAHVHRSGIVHRDIKPANVYLQPTGRVTLMDFGISRSAAHTQSSTLLGTLHYLAPEQVRQQPTTSLSDVYSYGVLLFELFSGLKPFQGDTAQVLYQVAHERLSTGPLRAAALPPTLIGLIERATAKEPSSRFQTMDALVQELKQISPVAEARESGTSQANPIVKAHWPSRPAVAAAALLVVLAALAGGEYLRRKRTQTDPALGARVEVQRLTEAGTARRAAATPDGRYVAWVNEVRGTHELRLLQVASERDVVLLPAAPFPIFALHFSPDSDYLYFLRQLKSDDPASFGVFRIAALGGPATRLATEVGTQYSVTVSPDGKQIAYIAGPEMDIVSIDPNGRNRQTIARHRATDSFCYVEWSRSLERLAAVVGGNDGSMRLVTIELPSGTVREFPRISKWGALGQPAWSDDGARIFAPAVLEDSAESGGG